MEEKWREPKVLQNPRGEPKPEKLSALFLDVFFNLPSIFRGSLLPPLQETPKEDDDHEISKED